MFMNCDMIEYATDDIHDVIISLENMYYILISFVYHINVTEMKALVGSFNRIILNQLLL